MTEREAWIGNTEQMAHVDPDDDAVGRFIVWHYKFDLDRHERWNVVVDAFDNAQEMVAEIHRRSKELERRKERGEAEPIERISGVALRPGDAARSRARRIEWKRVTRTAPSKPPLL